MQITCVFIQEKNNKLDKNEKAGEQTIIDASGSKIPEDNIPVMDTVANNNDVVIDNKEAYRIVNGKKQMMDYKHVSKTRAEVKRRESYLENREK